MLKDQSSLPVSWFGLSNAQSSHQTCHGNIRKGNKASQQKTPPRRFLQSQQNHLKFFRFPVMLPE
jgi:hypothetical protein